MTLRMSLSPKQDEPPEVDDPFARAPAYPVSRSMSLIYKTDEADVFVYTMFETDAADEDGHWSKPRPPIEGEVSVLEP